MIVAPSILSVLNQNLKEIIKTFEQIPLKYLHLDVMDGIFVNNKTFNADFINSLRPVTKMVFDAHLMVDKPEQKLSEYINCGCDIITIHYEATDKIKAIIDLVKKSGKQIGIAIKPDTNVNVLDQYLKDLDLILIMSVNPGWGGQTFMPKALDKIKYLNSVRIKNHYSYLIEVDGGINTDTAQLVSNAGCDIIVVGTFLLNQPNIKSAAISLKAI